MNKPQAMLPRTEAERIAWNAQAERNISSVRAEWNKKGAKLTKREIEKAVR